MARQFIFSSALRAVENRTLFAHVVNNGSPIVVYRQGIYCFPLHFSKRGATLLRCYYLGIIEGGF